MVIIPEEAEAVLPILQTIGIAQNPSNYLRTAHNQTDDAL